MESVKTAWDNRYDCSESRTRQDRNGRPRRDSSPSASDCGTRRERDVARVALSDADRTWIAPEVTPLNPFRRDDRPTRKRSLEPPTHSDNDRIPRRDADWPSPIKVENASPMTISRSLGSRAALYSPTFPDFLLDSPQERLSSLPLFFPLRSTFIPAPSCPPPLIISFFVIQGTDLRHLVFLNPHIHVPCKVLISTRPFHQSLLLLPQGRVAGLIGQQVRCPHLSLAWRTRYFEPEVTPLQNRIENEAKRRRTDERTLDSAPARRAPAPPSPPLPTRAIGITITLRCPLKGMNSKCTSAPEEPPTRSDDNQTSYDQPPQPICSSSTESHITTPPIPVQAKPAPATSHLRLDSRLVEPRTLTTTMHHLHKLPGAHLPTRNHHLMHLTQYLRRRHLCLGRSHNMHYCTTSCSKSLPYITTSVYFQVSTHRTATITLHILCNISFAVVTTLDARTICAIVLQPGPSGSSLYIATSIMAAILGAKDPFLTSFIVSSVLASAAPAVGCCALRCSSLRPKQAPIVPAGVEEERCLYIEVR
ncbi:hypothetical protein JAAARDRAFT_42308 [Jaapia argillacea MUCL 33604]|uniref:Uncharacterized protein n=1 Tax=Jaapia argillacea MUCL 33604 TaxID=933084 RepID=A0A067P5D8_9AGAM|nr:hypothetical protein JAAARDRAFT_42308 [Jaapia argillacea MUCL 33604]